MSGKRAIPQVPAGDLQRVRFDEAVKEDLEYLMGQRGGKIKPLEPTATLADVIAKVNELVERLQ